MNYFLGIDIGGTNIKGGIVSEQGETLEFISIAVPNANGEAILNTTSNTIAQLLAKSANLNININTIGIGTPGVVDEKQGCVIDGCPNIPGWKSIKYIPILNKKFKKPIYSHNDVTCMALGELYFGSAQGKQNVICLTLGTGIGGGIIINNELYEGHNNYAGEIGHMTIMVNGRKCNCGKYGCWEAYASATGIAITAKEYMQKNTPENISVKQIFEQAKQNDPIATKIFNDTCLYLGIGIANLINIFNPEMIVIGGGISQTGNFLLDPIETIVKQNCMKLSADNAKIVPAKFIEKAGVIGAAAYAKKHYAMSAV